MTGANPKPLTLAQLRDATGLGPEWHVIWVGVDRFAGREHLCARPVGPGGACRSDWVRVRYAPTGTPGIQVAKCERCRTAWVRRVGG